MFAARMLILAPRVSQPALVTMRPVLAKMRPMSQKVNPSPNNELSLLYGSGAVASGFCFATLASFITPMCWINVWCGMVVILPCHIVVQPKTNY